MADDAFEIRPELQIRDDILALGFREERIVDETSIQLIKNELRASVQATTNGAQPSFVVLDMRQVQFHSTVALKQLICQDRMLSPGKWRLLLLVPRDIREAFATPSPGRWISLASDQNELRLLIDNAMTLPDVNEAPIDFSKQELKEMLATNITLDDAIRAVERLRG